MEKARQQNRFNSLREFEDAFEEGIKPAEQKKFLDLIGAKEFHFAEGIDKDRDENGDNIVTYIIKCGGTDAFVRSVLQTCLDKKAITQLVSGSYNETPLFIAVEKGYLDTIRMLLTKYKWSDDLGQKKIITEALLLAVRQNKVEVVKAFLEAYPNNLSDLVKVIVNQATGDNLFLWASKRERGHPIKERDKIIEFILASDIELDDKQKIAAFKQTIFDHRIEVAARILGKIENQVLENGDTLLTWMIKEVDPQVVWSILLQKESLREKLSVEKDQWGDGKSPLLIAAREALKVGKENPNYMAYIQIIETLVRQGYLEQTVSVDDQDNSLLTWAAIQDPFRVDLITSLIQLGFGLDAPAPNGNTPLIAAIRAGKINNIGALIGLNVDVNAPDKDHRSPLYWAAWQGDIRGLEIVKTLLNTGKIARKDKAAPFLIAAKYGHIGIVQHFLDGDETTEPVDKEARDSSGNSALILAAQGTDVDIVQVLVNHKVNVNATNNAQESALWYAVIKGSDQIVQVLLASKKVSQNEKDKALLLAAQLGHLEIVGHLLEADASINTTYVAGEKAGFTPLMLASQAGKLAVVNLLLEWDANVNVQTPQGTTALMLAVKQDVEGAEANRENYEDIVRSLIRGKANVALKEQSGLNALQYAIVNFNPGAALALLSEGDWSQEKEARITRQLIAKKGATREMNLFNAVAMAAIECKGKGDDNEYKRYVTIARHLLEQQFSIEMWMTQPGWRQRAFLKSNEIAFISTAFIKDVLADLVASIDRDVKSENDVQKKVTAANELVRLYRGHSTKIFAQFDAALKKAKEYQSSIDAHAVREGKTQRDYQAEAYIKIGNVIVEKTRRSRWRKGVDKSRQELQTVAKEVEESSKGKITQILG